MKKYLLSIIIIVSFYLNLKANWGETKFSASIVEDTLIQKKIEIGSIVFKNFTKKKKEIVLSSPSYVSKGADIPAIPPSGTIEFSFSPSALRTKYSLPRKDNCEIYFYQQNNPDAKFCLVNWYENRYFVHDYFDHEAIKNDYRYFPFATSYKKVLYYPKKTKKILGYHCYLAVVRDKKNVIHRVYITEAIQPSKESDNSYYLKGCPLEISQPDSEFYKRAVKVTIPKDYLEYHIPNEYETISTDKMIDIIKNHKYK